MTRNHKQRDRDVRESSITQEKSGPRLGLNKGDGITVSADQLQKQGQRGPCWSVPFISPPHHPQALGEGRRDGETKGTTATKVTFSITGGARYLTGKDI